MRLSWRHALITPIYATRAHAPTHSNPLTHLHPPACEPGPIAVCLLPCCCAWCTSEQVTFRSMNESYIGCSTWGGVNADGTPLRNGTACAFPFFKDGVQYDYCTDVGNFGVEWCSTTTQSVLPSSSSPCRTDAPDACQHLDSCRVLFLCIEAALFVRGGLFAMTVARPFGPCMHP